MIGTESRSTWLIPAAKGSERAALGARLGAGASVPLPRQLRGSDVPRPHGVYSSGPLGSTGGRQGRHDGKNRPVSPDCRLSGGSHDAQAFAVCIQAQADWNRQDEPAARFARVEAVQLSFVAGTPMSIYLGLADRQESYRLLTLSGLVDVEANAPLPCNRLSRARDCRQALDDKNGVHILRLAGRHRVRRGYAPRPDGADKGRNLRHPGERLLRNQSRSLSRGRDWALGRGGAPLRTDDHCRLCVILRRDHRVLRQVHDWDHASHPSSRPPPTHLLHRLAHGYCCRVPGLVDTWGMLGVGPVTCGLSIQHQRVESDAICIANGRPPAKTRVARRSI